MVFFLSPAAPARTLSFNVDTGVYTVTFDEGRYTDQQIKDLVQISPYKYITAFVVLPELEDCNP